MTDRELLEAAAKAAGIDATAYYGPSDEFYGLVVDSTGIEWNPLEDDGDALRLAVKLNLHIGIDAESAGAITVEWDFDGGGFPGKSAQEEAPIGGDDYAATRRAIVRAAAAIGEQK